jgi:hypothetical protein
MWLPVTLHDLKAHAWDERLDAATRNVLSAGDETAFDTLRAPVIARIRAKIASWRDNVLDTQPWTVPPEFHDLACLQILSALLSRPGSQPDPTVNQFRLTDDQRTRLEQGQKDLDAVAKGELAVTPPDSTSTDRTVVTPSIGTRTRTYGRETEDGL